ncbi:MAG: 16S rRNA (cytosine(967)-C(5))-methyltransferase RsmB [Deltaproteobacteria bacterium]|nr:16S rRNA (cytosine(967)-C(5))-methyltransferase RsmB [Deltaproteobacteria bacterium]
MKETPRSLAVDILNRIDEAGLFAEPLLDQALSGSRLTNIHDRHLLTEIVYGTLRKRGRIDGIIARFYNGDRAGMETGVKNILRTAVYQLLFTDRIPPFAIVNEAVKIAKISHRASSGLVYAILRNIIRRQENITDPDFSKNPAAHISQVHSHPLWLVERWLKQFGPEETLAICRANNDIPPLSVRINRLKTTREPVLAELGQSVFETRKTAFSPDGLILSGGAVPLRETPSYREGHLPIQDEASQLITCLVDPKPGMTVLDACAGAGIKTSHLAERMQNRGRILALDRSGQKLKAQRANMKRLVITIVETSIQDVSEDPDDALPGAFDRVLVDVPCSGLGTLRRNPEIKWRIRPADIDDFSSLQKRLIDQAARCLKRGGILVYSTCTLTPEENEAVIRDFLSRSGDFHLENPPDLVPASMVTGEGFFKTRPDLHTTDGFFGAILRRRP